MLEQDLEPENGERDNQFQEGSSAIVFKPYLPTAAGSPRANEPKPDRNPLLEDGQKLPPEISKSYKSNTMACSAMQEIDPAYENTFVVFGKGGTINRFSAAPSLSLFHPLHPLRKFAIHLTTHYAFAAAIVLAVWFSLGTQNFPIEALCIGVFIFEFLLKVVAQGLLVGEFSCLRKAWNWLDVFVIVVAILAATLPFTVFFMLRWCRILKVVSAVRVMRLEAEHLLRLFGSVVFPISVVILLSLGILSSYGLQIYMGAFTQKCIASMKESELGDTDAWTRHMSNVSNWLVAQNDPGSTWALCGNHTLANMCPENYTCLQGFGSNPNAGFTNFDSFIWSSVQTFRIASQDYLEEIVEQLIMLTGHWNVTYVLAVFFFGTYFIGTFSYGLFGNFYSETWQFEVEKEDEDNGVPADFRECPEPVGSSVMGKVRAFCSRISGSFGLDAFITMVILFDVVDCVRKMSILPRVIQDWNYFEFRSGVIFWIIFTIYVLEFVIKIIGQGPRNYFRNRWNVFDFLILLEFVGDRILYSTLAGYNGLRGGLFQLRFFKIVPRWTGLLNLVKTIGRTIRALKGLLAIAVTVWVLLALLGMQYFEPHIDYETKPWNQRWNFFGGFNSFMLVYRSWGKETIELVWDCMVMSEGTRNSPACFIYFGFVQFFCHIFLISITVRIVILIEAELKAREGVELARKSTLARMWEIITLKPWNKLKSLLGQGDQDATGSAGILPMDAEVRKSRSRHEGEGEDHDSSGIGSEDGHDSRANGNEGYAKMKGLLDHPIVDRILFFSLIFFVATLGATGIVGAEVVFFTDLAFILVFGLYLAYAAVVYGIFRFLESPARMFDFIVVLGTALSMYLHFEPLGLTMISFLITWPRCLRPLMLVSRVDGMKAVVSGMWGQFKTLWSYFLSVGYVWVYFSVWMHFLFSYTFYRCEGPDVVTDVDDDHIEIKYRYNKYDCLARNYSWVNAHRNFDNGVEALTSLIAIALRNGWISIIHSASDSTGDHLGGFSRNYSQMTTVIWVMAFLVIGVLFCVSTIFGVAVHYTKKSKKMFFSKQRYDAYQIEKAASQEPSSTLAQAFTRPEPGCRARLFDVVTSLPFEIMSVSVIILTFVTLVLDHYNASYQVEVIFDSIFSSVVLYLVVEVSLKLVALGKQFFSSTLNWIDFIAAITSFASLILSDLLSKYFVHPIIFFLLRPVKIFFFPPFHGLLPDVKDYLRSVSLVRGPLLGVLGTFCLFMYSYMNLGWSMFSSVAGAGGRHPFVHFQTVSGAFHTLFRLSTFSGFDGILQEIGNEEDCNPPDGERDPWGTCGNSGVALLYTVSYVFLSFFLFMNFYLVLIVEFVDQIKQRREKIRGC